MKRLLALILALAVSLPSGAFAVETVDRIVAIVNGDIITLFDLDRETAPIREQFKGAVMNDEQQKQYKKFQMQVLQKMVDEMLLDQQLDKLGIEVGEAEVENYINRIKQTNGLTEEDLEKQLKVQQLSRQEFEDGIRADIKRHRLLAAKVRRKVVVTDTEIDEYYKANQDKYVQDPSIDLSLILLPAGVSASELREKILSGEISFADAAKQHSVGPAKDAGGELGEFKWEELAPEWRDAVTGVQAGEMSQPFTITEREALLRVNKSASGEARKLDDKLKEQIREVLSKPKFEKIYQEFMTRLRDNAVIKIKL